MQYMLTKVVLMKHLLTEPSKAGVIQFFLWYRFFALGYVAFLHIAGLHQSPVWLLAIATAYNILVFRLQSNILARAAVFPYFLALDMMFVYMFIYLSAVLNPPYYLYSFSPLFFGAFVFGYRGAIFLSIIHSVGYLTTKYLGGFDFGIWAGYGEHFSSYFFIYFFIAIIPAHLSQLLDKFSAAHKERRTAEAEVLAARTKLEDVLINKGLSAREIQALMMAFAGKTNDQVAAELGVTKSTAKTYLKRAYDKIGVTTKKAALSEILNSKAEV